MSEEKFFRALEICDKLDFFQGQRAGRELWLSKPVEVQNEDLVNFGKNIAFIKDVLNCQQAEIERLEEKLSVEIADGGASCHMCIEKHKTEAITEFADKLLEKGAQKHWVDNLVKEMGCGE